MAERINIDTLRLDLNDAIIDAQRLRARDAGQSPMRLVAGDLLRQMDALVAVVRTQVRLVEAHRAYARSTLNYLACIEAEEAAQAALAPFLPRDEEPAAAKREDDDGC